MIRDSFKWLDAFWSSQAGNAECRYQLITCWKGLMSIWLCANDCPKDISQNASTRRLLSSHTQCTVSVSLYISFLTTQMSLCSVKICHASYLQRSWKPSVPNFSQSDLVCFHQRPHMNASSDSNLAMTLHETVAGVHPAGHKTEPPKKKHILSMKYWLFNRDPCNVFIMISALTG